MLRKYCKTPAVLRQRSGIEDGKPVWTESDVSIRVMDMTELDVDVWGIVRGGQTILIAPPTRPVLPAQIVIDGKTYDLQQVRVCRSLDGNLAGCRCLVVM